MLDTVLSKVMAGVIAALLLALIAMSGYNWVLNVRIEEKKSEIAKLTAANDIMKVSIDNQNKAFDDLKEKDDALKKKAALLVNQAHKDAVKYREKAESIKNQVVSGDDCQGANTLLSGYISGLGL